jgi:RNase adapter protein RapZ
MPARDVGPRAASATPQPVMRLIIVSGLSGAGKSIALHMLEDLDYYCVDNIPAALLKPFVSHTLRSRENLYRRTGVGIDARNTASECASLSPPESSAS